MSVLHKTDKNQSGVVLIVCVLMLSMISLIAGSLVNVTTSEYKSSVYAVRAQQALYDAEAGVRYAINCINADLRSGGITFASNPDSINVAYSAPANFNFDDITELTRLNNNGWYMFSVTGHSANVKSVLEVTICRPGLFGDVGVFGGDSVELQPWQCTYSYRSTDILAPTPADSTGEANVGSNGKITVKPHVTLDGIFILGCDELGVYYTLPSGYPGEYVPRIDPDPLGARDGALAVAISNAVTVNDNAAAGIVGDVINLGAHASQTISGGHYYVTDFYLGSHSTLTVNATPEDPAVFYLQGGFRLQPHCNLNITSGTPRSFYIFSDSGDDVRLQPNLDFMGFIYAPYADIRVQPHNDYYGVLWGASVRIQPGGDIFVDVSLLDEFYSAYVEIVQWKRL